MEACDNYPTSYYFIVSVISVEHTQAGSSHNSGGLAISIRLHMVEVSLN